MSTTEEVGLGVSSGPIENVTPDFLAKIWKHMVVKIKQPNLFLPVTNVKTEDCDGYVKRSMELKTNGDVLKENIYSEFDGETGEIRFVVLKDGKETDNEIINALYKDPPRIEYFQRSISSGERVHFGVPKHLVLEAISKTIEFARQE